MKQDAQLIEQIESYAQKQHIPIIESSSIMWLEQFLQDKPLLKILEIGAAIGYSALKFCSFSQAQIITIEKDPQRFAMAQQFIEQSSYADRIQLYLDDAQSDSFYQIVKQHAPYDLLFIDATKRKNQLFFQKFAPFVQTEGYIITDNINFRGLTQQSDVSSVHRRIRPMIRAISEYRSWLEQLEMYDTEFIDVGDTLAITQKKGVTM